MHAAGAQDIHVLGADALADNHAMHKVFTDLGLATNRHWADAQVRLEAVLDEPATPYLDAVEARGSRADVASLRPLVVFGAGGTTADLLDDRTARLAPLTDADTMITSLRTTPLLLGYRDAPAVDVQRFKDLLARLGRVTADVTQVAEADLNPLVCGPDGVVCVDARIRLEPRRTPDPYLRRLRRLPDAPGEPA